MKIFKDIPKAWEVSGINLIPLKESRNGPILGPLGSKWRIIRFLYLLRVINHQPQPAREPGIYQIQDFDTRQKRLAMQLPDELPQMSKTAEQILEESRHDQKINITTVKGGKL